MHIFENTKLNNLNFKNRLFRSATWDGLAKPDGALTDEIYDIYEKLADGGAGAIVTGAMDVSPYDWALIGSMRLCSDLLIPDYKKLTDIVHKYDCRIFAQLNMNEYFRSEKRPVKVSIDKLTQEDIDDIVKLFADAAKRAKKADFDGVQIDLAYGWLLNRFINPTYNKRTDSYGETNENRVKIAIEIMENIKFALDIP